MPGSAANTAVACTALAALRLCQGSALSSCVVNTDKLFIMLSPCARALACSAHHERACNNTPAVCRDNFPALSPKRVCKANTSTSDMMANARANVARIACVARLRDADYSLLVELCKIMVAQLPFRIYSSSPPRRRCLLFLKLLTNQANQLCEPSNMVHKKHCVMMCVYMCVCMCVCVHAYKRIHTS